MDNSKNKLEDLVIERTPRTPEIKFANGIFEIKGRSIPDNSETFYAPVLGYLSEYVKNPCDCTEVNFYIEYFNISSSESLRKVFGEFKKIYDLGKSVKINWYYDEDDGDMLMAGQDFGEEIEIPMKLIEIID